MDCKEIIYNNYKMPKVSISYGLSAFIVILIKKSVCLMERVSYNNSIIKMRMYKTNYKKGDS